MELMPATGALPERKNTVIAEVLAHLLDGHHITGLEAVFESNSTRLAHHIHALGKGHGWTIVRCEKVVGTADGRVQAVSEYWLDPDVIEAAMKLGAREWVASVRKARAARRAKAAQAKREAERQNAARRRTPTPYQMGLFAAVHHG